MTKWNTSKKLFKSCKKGVKSPGQGRSVKKYRESDAHNHDSSGTDGDPLLDSPDMDSHPQQAKDQPEKNIGWGTAQVVQQPADNPGTPGVFFQWQGYGYGSTHAHAVKTTQ